MEFDWDYANRAHLAVHDVTPAEFEQLFAHPRYERFIVRKDEPRTWCLGQTDAGRAHPGGNCIHHESERKEVL